MHRRRRSRRERGPEVGSGLDRLIHSDPGDPTAPRPCGSPVTGRAAGPAHPLRNSGHWVADRVEPLEPAGPTQCVVTQRSQSTAGRDSRRRDAVPVRAEHRGHRFHSGAQSPQHVVDRILVAVLPARHDEDGHFHCRRSGHGRWWHSSTNRWVWWVPTGRTRSSCLIRVAPHLFQRSPTMADRRGGSQPNMLDAQPMLSIIIAPPM